MLSARSVLLVCASIDVAKTTGDKPYVIRLHLLAQGRYTIRRADVHSGLICQSIAAQQQVRMLPCPARGLLGLRRPGMCEHAAPNVESRTRGGLLREGGHRTAYLSVGMRA